MICYVLMGLGFFIGLALMTWVEKGCKREERDSVPRCFRFLTRLVCPAAPFIAFDLMLRSWVEKSLSKWTKDKKKDAGDEQESKDEDKQKDASDEQEGKKADKQKDASSEQESKKEEPEGAVCRSQDFE